MGRASLIATFVIASVVGNGAAHAQASTCNGNALLALGAASAGVGIAGAATESGVGVVLFGGVAVGLLSAGLGVRLKNPRPADARGRYFRDRCRARWMMSTGSLFTVLAALAIPAIAGERKGRASRLAIAVTLLVVAASLFVGGVLYRRRLVQPGAVEALLVSGPLLHF